jgi:serine/threonine protein kinase
MNHVDIDIKTFFPIVSRWKHKERYEQEEIIGQGTFGRVYKYLDKQTHTKVAIKRYHDDYNDKEIVQEVDVLMKLHHQNIVEYINHYKIFDDKSYLLIIEYMEKDLYDYILTVSGPLDSELIKSYLYQLLSGVNYMHENEYMHLGKFFVFP